MFQGPVSRKSRKLFVPEKPFVKLRPAYSVTLALSYVVNGWKIKITVKFCASRCCRFEDTKGIMSPEMRPKSFGTFEKRIPDFLFFYWSPWNEASIVIWVRGIVYVITYCSSPQSPCLERYRVSRQKDHRAIIRVFEFRAGKQRHFRVFLLICSALWRISRAQLENLVGWKKPMKSKNQAIVRWKPPIKIEKPL